MTLTQAPGLLQLVGEAFAIFIANAGGSDTDDTEKARKVTLSSLTEKQRKNTRGVSPLFFAVFLAE